MDKGLGTPKSPNCPYGSNAHALDALGPVIKNARMAVTSNEKRSENCQIVTDRMRATGAGCGTGACSGS